MPSAMRNALTALVLSLASLAFLGPMGATLRAQPLPALAPTVAKPADPEPAPEVPAAYASPRATLRTFLEAMAAAAATGDKQHVRTAALCLDLSHLPAGVVEDLGADLAVKLKDVMDHLSLVRLASVPTVVEGDSWVWRTLETPPARIALARVADGRWLFDAETVKALDGLYDHFADKPKVAGATRFSLALSPALWFRSQMPSALTAEWFLMEHWQWLFLLGLLFIGWLAGRIVRALLAGPVDRFLARRSARVPPDLIARTLAPLSIVVMGGVWHVGLGHVGLDPEVAAVILVVFKFLAAFGVIRVAMRAIHIVTHVLAERARATPNRFDDLAVPFFHKTAMVLIVSLGLLFMGDVLGLSPTSLLAGLGLGGLAIALAAQDTVKNLFGSFTVILDRPFEIGDAIKLSNDVQGTVEEVGFRSTRLRSHENTLITVPNGNLISANVENFGKRTYFRWRTVLNLAYHTPADRVDAFANGVLELIRLHPHTRKDACSCHFDEFGPSSIDLLLICHFTATAWADFVAAKHALLLEILELARRLDVTFAYPTQTIHLARPSDGPGPAARPVVPLASYTARAAEARLEAAAVSGQSRQPPAEPTAVTDTQT
jgi:MscS family membrane protein